MKLVNKQPMATSDVLITVVGVPGYWSKFSGVKETFTRPEYSDGLTNRKRYASTGSSGFEDITIARAYDPENADDVAAYQWVQDNKYGNEQNLTIRPVRRDKETTQRGSKAFNVSGARIKEYSLLSDMDTGAGDGVVELVVVFSVDDVTYA